MAWSIDKEIQRDGEGVGTTKYYTFTADSTGLTLADLDDCWAMVYDASVVDNTSTVGVIDVIWDGSDVTITNATGTGTVLLRVEGTTKSTI